MVARFVVCVVDSWRWAPSCGVVLSGGPCLLDPWLQARLHAVKREFHVPTWVTWDLLERLDLPNFGNSDEYRSR